MKNIPRFLKGSRKYMILIVLLLILQAYCDLSLPAYTSSLINVGLQQSGIESPIPQTIRSSVLEDLELFVPDEQLGELETAYEKADSKGIRHLKEDADTKRLEELMALPESILFQMSNAPDAAFSPDQIRAAIAAGVMTKEQFLDQVSQSIKAYAELSENYLSQIAVGFVAAEYKAQNLDLNQIQNRYLFSVGAKMMLMTLLMSAAAIAVGFLSARASARTGRNLREQIYNKVMSFTSAEIERFSTASLITRCTNDVQQVQFVVVMLLRMVAYAPILAVFGIIRVVQTGAGMGWVIVLAVVLLSACVGILIAIAMPRFKIMQSLVDKLNLVSRETLNGIMPIRAFHREQHEMQRFEKANKDLYETQLFTTRTMVFMSPVMMLIMNGISVLIVWVGASRVDTGVIQVGDLTAFITYSMVIVMGFLMLTGVSIFLPRAGVAADRIAEVLDTGISLKDPEEPKDDRLFDPKGEITFEDVSFTYPGAQSPALQDISFTAKPGETTGIIGSTGCGKSTLLNLIPRFYDVTEGKITLDGIDIRDLTQQKLRDQIGYIPQKGMLFSGTVETNLKYADASISDEMMKEAARIAQAAPFIEEKPDGYQSMIAQEGSNVSGGQRQRLSIARAIAKQPKVYLFDDSFSALDYKTDLALRTELKKSTEDAAVIIVAQRIATILHADKILCLENGKIAGMGTHEQLLKNCPAYLEIARSQLSEAELKKMGVA